MDKVFYGTFGLEKNSKTTECVLNAIDVGYSSFDCAYSYGNDFYVGKALKNSCLDRQNYFVTNKVWKTVKSKQEVIDMCKKSLRLMKLDYFDLYLVHWPISINEDDWQNKILEIWSGMEELYKQDLVKNIGVSNFLEHHLEVLKDAEIKPCLNQIECHIGHYPKELIEYCLRNHIQVQAWSPLGNGKLLNDEKIKSISDKYKVSTAELCLNWCQAHDISYVCKSSNKERMLNNLNIKEILINENDMEYLDGLENIGYSGFDPDNNQPE